MTLPPPICDPSCDLILRDLLKKRRWNSALEISLFEHRVVAARQFYNSPIVVFIPIGDNVKLFDMKLVLNRVKQLGLDLSTGEMTLESNSREEEKSDDLGRLVCPSEVISTPEQPSTRFVKDETFDRDRCLRLHNDVSEKQFEFELALEAEEQKKARVEEIRLGLVSEDYESDSNLANENPPDKEMSQTSSQHPDFDRTVDIHISAMFAFCEGGNLCYYQATLGLAPPEYCPDDSDDEKPLEQVQQEMKKTQMKRKNME